MNVVRIIVFVFLGMMTQSSMYAMQTLKGLFSRKVVTSQPVALSLPKTDLLEHLVEGREVSQVTQKVYEAKDFDEALVGLDWLGKRGTEGSFNALIALSQAPTDKFINVFNVLVVPYIRRYAHVLIIQRNINRIKSDANLTEDIVQDLCSLFKYFANWDHNTTKITLNLALSMFIKLGSHPNKSVIRFYKEVLDKLYNITFYKSLLTDDGLAIYKKVLATINRDFKQSKSIRELLIFIINNHPQEKLRTQMKEIFAATIKSVLRGHKVRKTIEVVKSGIQDKKDAIDKLHNQVMDAVTREIALPLVAVIDRYQSDEHSLIRDAAQKALRAIAVSQDDDFTYKSIDPMGLYGSQDGLSAYDKQVIRDTALGYVKAAQRKAHPATFAIDDLRALVEQKDFSVLAAMEHIDKIFTLTVSSHSTLEAGLKALNSIVRTKKFAGKGRRSLRGLFSVIELSKAEALAIRHYAHGYAKIVSVLAKYNAAQRVTLEQSMPPIIINGIAYHHTAKQEKKLNDLMLLEIDRVNQQQESVAQLVERALKSIELNNQAFLALAKGIIDNLGEAASSSEAKYFFVAQFARNALLRLQYLPISASYTWLGRVWQVSDKTKIQIRAYAHDRFKGLLKRPTA